MGNPTRKTCLAPWLVPNGKHLRRLITRGRHLVLQFPKLWSDSLLSGLTTRLQAELPENYQVFNAGTFSRWKCVTVMEVISREEVSEISPVLLTAARRFREDANSLARELAKLNGIRLDDLSPHDSDITIFPENWDVYSHGNHFCFTHRTTKQVIEICTMYGDEFGVLDPYFLHQYMAMTKGLWVPKQIVEPYHDTCRAMELLEANGSLRRISRNEWLTGHYAPQPDDMI